MIGVDLIGQIRRAYFEQQRSIKEIVRTLLVSRATVRKVKFPVLKDIDKFVFADTPVDEGLVRENISVAAPFVWRCLNGSTMARFHIPLIEPDMQISRIRLSDKNSRFRVQRLLQFLTIYRS